MLLRKFFLKSYLNEYLPLKQGLRHISDVYVIVLSILNEYLPLKQGLRQILRFA